MSGLLVRLKISSKPARINVRQIDHDAEAFALSHKIASEICQTLRRRSAGGEDSAIGRGIRTRMG